MMIRRHIEYNITRLRLFYVCAMLLVFQGSYAQVARDTITVWSEANQVYI